MSDIKNIFIGGVARSGKSTLAKRLCAEGNYNHFPLDYVTSSLKNNFPECEISSSVIMGDSSQKLALLLSTIVKIMDSKEEKFIIDSAHIMPKDIVPYLDKDKWDIYFVGYPNISKYSFKKDQSPQAIYPLFILNNLLSFPSSLHILSHFL